MVRLDESAEFALASNSAFGFRNEGYVQYRVVTTRVSLKETPLCILAVCTRWPRGAWADW
jgi:hypothetical protein